ncbi:MAG: GNAT family N-acetyltransferase [Leadbetterella sp.]|jgi:PhnO protein|nr:GNAT family N-acetyltransferase [Leadbetterella sp.]
MIRKAKDSDLEFVKLLVEELEEQKFELEIFKEIYFKNLVNNEVHYFVAEVNNEIVGFMSIFESMPLHHCHKLAEIQELIISVKHRGLSIGKEFIELATKLGQEKGWLQIELSSHMKRLKAHSFYMRNGFNRRHFKFVKMLK